jgi:hypothetical protein
MKIKVVEPKITCIQYRVDNLGYLIKVQFSIPVGDSERSYQLRATRLYDEEGSIIPFDIQAKDKNEVEFNDVKEEFNNWGEMLDLGKEIRMHENLKNTLDQTDIEYYGDDDIFSYLNEDLGKKKTI